MTTPSGIRNLGRSDWGPLILGLLLVLVPTVSVFWFMNVAVRNERLASRQKLVEIADRQLVRARADLQKRWADHLVNLNPGLGPWSAQEYALRLKESQADALVILDPDGAAAFPRETQPPVLLLQPDPRWSTAWQLEITESNPEVAASVYAGIARDTVHSHEKARALQSQIRCLVQAGQRRSALLLATQAFENLDEALDETGRLIVAQMELLALELIQDPNDPRFQLVADRLYQRLRDDDHAVMPGSQRIFLMTQWEQLTGKSTSFPSLASESLAEQFRDLHSTDSLVSGFHPTRLDGVWMAIGSDRNIVALYRTDSLRNLLDPAANQNLLLPDSRVELLSPADRDEGLLTSLPLDDLGPGWKMGLKLSHAQGLEDASAQAVVRYGWIAILVTAVLLVGALFLGKLVHSRIRVARLKNDLAATVSHELKTPLAAMRVLVDTLLEAQSLDESQVRDYLRLLEKENARLSHLIDQFLTFSRLERRKPVLSLAEVHPSQLLERVRSAMVRQFPQASKRIEIQTSSGVSPFKADPDALFSAVCNLTENALKFSGPEQAVKLRAVRQNGDICLSVEDQGIGLTRRELRKVFDQYYQVDRRLSRSGSGCGLGLSIVKRIVEAHRGRVEAVSTPGQGSRFRILLPIQTDQDPPDS